MIDLTPLAFYYPSSSSEGATEPPSVTITELHEAATLGSFQALCVKLIGAACILALVYMGLLLFVWWIEKRGIIGSTKFSLFKLMTFGHCAAGEVSGLKVFWYVFLVYFVVIALVTGFVKTFILWLLDVAFRIATKI